MTQNNNQSSPDSAIGAFAGLVILIAILSILFIVTSPEESQIVDSDVVASVPTEVPPPPTEVPPPPTEVPAPVEAAASLDPELVALGQNTFMGACSGCHGLDAHGIPGVGKDLVLGEFPTTASDDELAAFIVTGRPIWDPANTTGVDMPPKGGNPALSNDDIRAIIAYLRSLQMQ